MVLLSASNLKKAFVEEVLFEDASFMIQEQDKVGFVGRNGVGKTTLFKMITGQSSITSGELYLSKNASVGYMEQHTCSNSDNTVWEELMTVFETLTGIEQELETVAAQISQNSPELEALVRRQHQLQERFEGLDGFTYKSRARAALLGMGFAEAELSSKVGTLSGGQKTRLSLCKILLSSANLLLLDEPTNHLDIASVEWLEDFLRAYTGAVIVISHDRYFLDRVTNKTMEMEHGHLTVYPGAYTKYVQLKAERDLTKRRQYDRTVQEIKRIEGIIEQQKRFNQKRNYITIASKQKSIDRLEKTLEAPESELESMRFQFAIDKVGGNDVLETEGLAMGFGQKKLFSNLNMYIKRKDRAFLLGPNGCGKTTLLRIVMGELEPLAGSCKIGANVDIGYYDQVQAGLVGGKTVFEEIQDQYPSMSNTEVRNALAAFLFRGEDVFKEVDTLSGGERARVLLLKLMLSRANFLLLDEPTNHLDIASREALEDALEGYEGTLLVVSHDRYFINKLASRIFYMTTEGVENYQGNYDFYLEKQRPVLQEQAAQKQSKNDYQLKKELQSKKRKAQSALKRAEEAIEAGEAELERLNEELALHATDYEVAMELTAALEAQQALLEQLYEEWERCSAQAEALE